MTFLYQVTLRGKVVETVTAEKKKVKRWFYIDIGKALNPNIDREEAIIGVPEDKMIRQDYGRDVVLDLSTPQHEPSTGLSEPSVQRRVKEMLAKLDAEVSGRDPWMR